MAHGGELYLSNEVYVLAVVACIVLLTLGLIGNAVVLGTNFDIRRIPDNPYTISVTMNRVAVGLPCIANVVVGTFAVAWFTYVGVVGAEYARHLQPTCGVVSSLFVWTSVLYLTGLLAMAVDRILEVCHTKKEQISLIPLSPNVN